MFIIGTGSSSSGHVLFWGLLLFLAFAISSGWVYYLAFRYLDNKVKYGVFLSFVAGFFDFLFSIKFLNGSSDYLPSLGYAICGFVLFYIIYFVNRPKSESTR